MSLSSRFLRSCITSLLPMLSKFISIFGKLFACFKASFTVFKSFCSVMGFSRKSKAPILVASKAVSIVPCPDIITTGLVINFSFTHSLRRVMPSQSGIHISNKIKSGILFFLSSRASVAFSATKISKPSSIRISLSNSLMPNSSSTTSIFFMLIIIYF